MAHGAKIRLVREVNGVQSVLVEPTGALDAVKLGDHTADIVTSEFEYAGNVSYSDAKAAAGLLNKLVADRFRPEAVAFEDAWTARNVRSLLGFKHDEDKDTNWWLTVIAGGYGEPTDAHWSLGKLDPNNGYFKLTVQHLNWWWQDAMTNVGTDAVIGNAANSNLKVYNFQSIADAGNINPIIRLQVKNTVAKKMKRVVVGMGRNAQAFSTQIADWLATSIGVPYTANQVAISLSASTITTANYPSGQGRVVIALDGVAIDHSQFQFSVDGGYSWSAPVEAGSNLIIGPILRIRATRVSGLSGNNQSISLHVRNIGGSSKTWPAGKLHILPCDQWNEWRLHTMGGINTWLVEDGRFDERYLKTGASSAEYDCISRYGAPLNAPPGWASFGVMVEDEDGRSDQFAGTLTLDAWARRRGI